MRGEERGERMRGGRGEVGDLVGQTSSVVECGVENLGKKKRSGKSEDYIF